MPLVLQQEIAPGATLGLWKTEETVGELLPLCTPQERRQAEAFTHEHRRREWLAWHALLQTLLPGARAGYDGQGGPRLENGPHIGVSHTPGYAAVIFAGTPCAVDIESIGRNYARVLNRYASPQEQALGQSLPDPTLYPTLFWCAKETLYKLKRQPGVDFLHDMHIKSADPDARSLQTRFREIPQPLQYLFLGSLCCVFGLE